MSKRKFEGTCSEYRRPKPQSSREEQQKVRKLGKAVENGKNVLFKALKIASVFERQKLGRRQKDARQKSNDRGLVRLDSEIAALKVLR